MKGRYDLRRSAIALFAALLAGIGAYSAVARGSVPFTDQAVLLLGAETVVGLALALWPGRPWSRRRRYVSLGFAFAGLVLMVPGPLISAIAVPGCICPAQPPYPALLGIGHQYWTIAGLVGFPVVLALASIHSVQSRHAGTPPEPEAST